MSAMVPSKFDPDTDLPVKSFAEFFAKIDAIAKNTKEEDRTSDKMFKIFGVYSTSIITQPGLESDFEKVTLRDICKLPKLFPDLLGNFVSGVQYFNTPFNTFTGERSALVHDKERYTRYVNHFFGTLTYAEFLNLVGNNNMASKININIFDYFLRLKPYVAQMPAIIAEHEQFKKTQAAQNSKENVEAGKKPAQSQSSATAAASAASSAAASSAAGMASTSAAINTAFNQISAATGAADNTPMEVEGPSFIAAYSATTTAADSAKQKKPAASQMAAASTNPDDAATNKTKTDDKPKPKPPIK